MAKGNSRDLQAILHLAGVVDPSLQRVVAEAQKLMRPLDKDLIRWGDSLSKLGDSMQKAGKTLTKAVTLPLVAAGTAAVKTFTGYDDAIRQVQATLGATPEEFDRLSAAAKQMGIETRYTASDSAAALNAIAQAGYNADESISLLPKVLNAAQAGSLGLEEAASIVTESMASLGLQVSEMDALIDQLAIGGRATNTDIAGLGEALKVVGADARGLRGGTAELITQLGILSNYGIKASEGGTAFRRILKNIRQEKGQKTLNALGVSVYDLQGNLRGTNAIFADLYQVTQDMTQQQRDAVMLKIFDTQALAGANALMLESVGIYGQIEEQVRNSQGTAAEMAAILEGGIGGAFRDLFSAIEGLAIAFGELLAPEIKAAAKWLTEQAKALAKLNPQTKKTILNVAKWAAALGPLLKIGGKLVSGIGKLMTKMGEASGAAQGIIGLLTGSGGLLGGLLLVGGALFAGIAAWGAWRREAAKEGLAARLGDAAMSAEQMRAAIEDAQTLSDLILDRFQTVSDELSELRGGLAAQSEATAALILSIDPTVVMTPEEQETLKQAIRDEISGVESALSAEKRKFIIAASFVFADDDGTRSARQGEIDRYYGQFQELATAKGHELNEAFGKAMEDGILDEQERAIINKLREDLNQIYAEASMFDFGLELDLLNEKAKRGEFSLESIREFRGQVDEAFAQDLASLQEVRDTRDLWDTGQWNLWRNTGGQEGIDYDEYQRRLDQNQKEYDEGYLQTQARSAKIWSGYLKSTAEAGFSEEIAALDAVMAGGIAQFADAGKLEFEQLHGWSPVSPEDLAEAGLLASEIYKHQLDFALDGMGQDNRDQAYAWLEQTAEERQALESIAAEYMAQNAAVPEDIADALAVFEKMQMIAGGFSMEDHMLDAEALYQAGQAATESFKEGGELGLQDASELAAAANTLGTDGVVNPFGAATGVASPSYIAEEQGKFYAQGAANGMLGMTGEMGAASQALADAALEPTQQMVTTMAGEVSTAWSTALATLSQYMTAAALSIQTTANNMANAVVAAAQRAAATMASISGGGGKGSNKSAVNVGVNKYAAGGTLDSPTLALIAEAGRETVVPHNDKPRSRALALEALRGTGLSLGGPGGGGAVFSPTIHITIQGNADAGVLEAAAARMKEELDQWLEERRRNDGRESFAWQP